MAKVEQKNEVLYRKYRPQNFEDVIGQDHIVKVLEGAVKLGNLSHAYLFSGTRGTGKTSMARIFARAIGTSNNDLVEMDAASRNGVDDIRELNENVFTLPYDSKFKVYIFDEVHMLSKSAWNAFLKTLEEPPAHVIFILATTEQDKVPETVISRCQIYKFKSPNLNTLREFALGVAKKEGVKLEASAAELVAILGDGSFRDTHGILEKVLSFSTDKTITREEVETVTGAPKSALVRDVVEAVVTKNFKKGATAIESAAEANVDMKFFAKLILERLRFLFLIRLKAQMDEYVAEQVSEDDFQFLKTLATQAGSDFTSDILLKFIEAYESSGRGAIPELSLELALADAIKA